MLESNEKPTHKLRITQAFEKTIEIPLVLDGPISPEQEAHMTKMALHSPAWLTAEAKPTIGLRSRLLTFKEDDPNEPGPSNSLPGNIHPIKTRSEDSPEDDGDLVV